jgi:putative acyl-CoA dehydrogenase
MTGMQMSSRSANQPPPLVDYDVTDAALVEALHREGAGEAEHEVRALGRRAGGEQAQRWGRLANEQPPALRSHDRYGNRIDEVEYHPAYHDLMRVAVESGIHAAPWRSATPGAHVVRAAKEFVWGQAEAGHMCPISMTYAIVPALRKAPQLSARFEPLLATSRYDVGLRQPLLKTGLLAGMSMTERQGGSDVRTNTTCARPDPDGSYRISGHKWFTSAPMSDLFLTLAQAPGGLSCFLVPRVQDDGSRNGLRLERLKDKLGNRSNASAELAYDGACGWLVGDEGAGVRTIIEMVNMTRLDCVIGAATGMRAGLAQAIHHATYRTAFGRPLREQPAMANVLADLALESEAATALAMRLAGAVDRSVTGDSHEMALRRIALGVGKYWVCKRWPMHAAEALECLGGNGYVEESGMPRIYREAPLLSIWEGSGNVNALDVLRVISRQPESVDAYFAEVRRASGANRYVDGAITELSKRIKDVDESGARRLVERLALVLQASLLVRHAPHAVADAFCATRLGGDWGHALGTLPKSVDTTAIIDRAAPATN